MNSQENNAVNSLKQLLRMSKVRVTRRTLRDRLWQHSEFPSLASLSDTLDDLKVPNMSVRLTQEQLNEVPLPAIAYLDIDGGIFAPVRSISKDEVEWLHTEKGWHKQNQETFDKRWSGIMLLIEPNQESGENNYNKKRRLEQFENSRYPFIFVGLLICLGLLLSYGFQSIPFASNWPLYTLIGLKLLGTIISCLLILYSFNSDNPLLNSFCQLSKRNNCNSILNSKASKLWDWGGNGGISWSEIGLVYFAGSFVAIGLSLLVPSASAIQALLWVNLLALPFTLYSIYYQVFVAKEFCVLCTAVQVILWLEFLVGKTLFGEISLDAIGLTVFSFVLVTVLWVFIKRPLNMSMQVEPLERELQKLKFNTEYVQGLFNKQRKMLPIFNGMDVVTLGNPLASHTLTMVTNPLCRPCAKAHQGVEQLLNNTSDVKCEIIFATTNEASAQVARRVMSLPPENVADALHQWFKREDKDVAEWSTLIKSDIETESSHQQLNLHRRWRELGAINSTPTFFLDAIQLPPLYRIKDVIHLCKIFVPQDELLLV